MSCDCHVTNLDEYAKSMHGFEVVLQKRKDDVKGVVDLRPYPVPNVSYQCSNHLLETEREGGGKREKEIKRKRRELLEANPSEGKIEPVGRRHRML